MNMRRTETQSVKDALVQAGYTGVRVHHCTGTGWGWLRIKADPLPGQSWHDKLHAIENIAQAVTGRHGEYGGRINVS